MNALGGKQAFFRTRKNTYFFFKWKTFLFDFFCFFLKNLNFLFKNCIRAYQRDGSGACHARVLTWHQLVAVMVQYAELTPDVKLALMSVIDDTVADSLPGFVLCMATCHEALGQYAEASR